MDREVWTHLVHAVPKFSKEKVDELARFASDGCSEMKAEVVKAAARKMVLSEEKYRIDVKVSVEGWGDAPDTFEVKGEDIKKLTEVASTLGVSFCIRELKCSRSILATDFILYGIEEHVKHQGDKMENLELMGIPRKCAPEGIRQKVFFALLKLTKKWKVMYLDWVPHGRNLALMSGDTNIATGLHRI